jgi:hypothetical protein
MDTKRTNRFLGTKGLLGAGALLALAVIFAPAVANAHEHHSGGGLFIGVAPDCGPVYSGGYYEDRYQTVLVEPAHYDRLWVAPIYETTYDPAGVPHARLVREGCWTNVYVPDRFETRLVRVWVPAPVYAPRVGIGFGFRF